MKDYFLTVFDKSGEMLLNESFQFKSDDEAITHGRKRLEEENYEKTTQPNDPFWKITYFSALELKKGLCPFRLLSN
ncbi:YhzD family protein [Thalassobacillus sp. C254]|uniref:YhzD family protein n=1 Tax=Thalassobacillus sp. C254 TaxID=1225341 RepID=UPI0006D1B106|nr:YhzD family protein [Thalassobacillus sp. C254]